MPSRRDADTPGEPMARGAVVCPVVGPSRTMASSATRSRLPLLPDVVGGVYALAYYAWLAFRTPGTPMTDLVGTVAYAPLGLAGAWAAWKTGGIAGLDAGTRRFWRLCAASFLALWASGSLWTLLVLFAPSAASREWTDWLTATHPALLVAAYLALPRAPILKAHRRRSLLDIALVVVAGFALVFYFELRAYFRPNVIVSPTYTLVGTALDWVAFVIAVVVYLRSTSRVDRILLALLIASHVVWLLANFILGESSTYRVGDPVDGLYFLAWMLRIVAARVAWHDLRTHGVEPVAGTVEYRSSLVPHILVSGAFLLLLALAVTGDTEYLEVGMVSAGVMTASLLARQMAEITENQRLFADNLAQEQRFQSLVQHSSDVVVLVGADRRVRYVSPAVESVLGGASELRPGVALADVARGDGEALTRLVTPGLPLPDRVQCRVRAADGRWRELEIVSRDLQAEPAVAGIVLNCRDVTERNELEQQLRHAQKLEAVGHLAGGLAHDFNNVLAVIRGYAEQLKADLPPTAEMRQQLDHLDQAVDRAAAVTKKLLAFGRHQSTKPIVIDLGRTLADLKPMLRHLLPSKTETVVESPPGLWHVKADPGQVEQVVLNLAFNGRDAMPDGGRLVIAAANRSVVGGEGTPAVPPGDYVALEVVDGGVGMSQEVQARIFEPFFTTKPRDQGSGLGLAMVYGIVTGAGGHIRVRSAPGQGTRFTIYWPSTREPLSQDSPRARQAVPSSAAASVLLVEDEAGVRSFTTRLLQRAGYSVTAVASGEEALFHFERYPQGVDLLVTDLVMPGMHGRELIDRVVTVRADLPVVCMTGFSGGDPDEPDLALKVAAVVDKPFRGEVLLDAVARALRPGPQDRATG